MYLVAACAYSGCVSRSVHRLYDCTNNMTVLHTYQDCILRQELGLRDGVEFPLEKLRPYLKNKNSAECPSGGNYIMGLVGEEPRCTIHGTMTEARTKSQMESNKSNN